MGPARDLAENLSENNLKGELSNAATFSPPLFSLVYTFNVTWCAQLFSSAETPQLPPSPRIWAHIRGALLVSKDTVDSELCWSPFTGMRNEIWALVFSVSPTIKRVNLNWPACTVHRPPFPNFSKYLYSVDWLYVCILTVVYSWSPMHTYVVTDAFHRKTGTLEGTVQLIIASCRICFSCSLQCTDNGADPLFIEYSSSRRRSHCF
jgi:hypothetical protein